MCRCDAHLDAVLAGMAAPGAAARDDQRTAVHALVDDRARVLVVQATGWGKSAVYWAATAALREQGAGCTLVISPLLSLMRDQVDAAMRAGLRAATINSANLEDWDDILASVDANELDVLLVSPERLANPGFAKRLPGLIAACGLIVIDEAHCISDWGFDFRPDYCRLARTLCAVGSDTAILATTATANQRVALDIAAQLGNGTRVLRGSLARSSIRLAVVPGLSPLERYAWVADALHTLPGSGIIYTLTVAETERLAAYLDDCGHDVRAYSSALDADQRREREAELRANTIKAMVATSALGMGYDKPDLGFVVHVGSPSSPVAYYQQVGRAGRAIDDAVAVLLPSESDERIWTHFATSAIPNPEHVDRLLAVLSDEPMSVVAIETATSLRRGRVEALLKLLAVDDVVERRSGGWVRGRGAWIYDAAKWRALAEVRAHEAEIMRSYAQGAGCLMRFLQVALDDPSPTACGRCSVCATEPFVASRPAPERVRDAERYVRQRDVVIEPRKLWPARAPRRGRITACAEGRALAFADDPGWQSKLAALGDADGRIDEELAAGIVSMLGRWRTQWAQRPVGIVPVPSRSHPERVTSIARAIATAGKLPIVEAIEITGPLPPNDTASSARVAALFAGLRVRRDQTLPVGPVFLVDDTMRSGWTLTVAGALLREAGIADVLPVVLHRLP